MTTTSTPTLKTLDYPLDDGVTLLEPPPDGIYVGVPESVYRRIKSLSQSQIKPAITDSLADMLHELKNPTTPNEQMLLGTATHTYALEPVAFEATIALTPTVDRRGNAGKQAWVDAGTAILGPHQQDEWLERCEAAKVEPHHDQGFAIACKLAGRTLVKPDWLALIREMAAKLLEHPTIGAALRAGGHREVAFFWTCPLTGIKCKGRLDLWNPEAELTIDLKTAARMGPARAPYPGLIKIVRSLRYDIQAAWYEQGFELAARAMGLELRLLMEFGFVQTTPPHHCTLVSQADLDIEAAHKDIREKMPQILEARRTGIWPGFPAHIEKLAARPDYAMSWED